MEMRLPTDFPTALALSKRIVQSVFIISAVLIGAFTVFVVREIQRRYRVEYDLGLTNHQKDQLISVIAHDLRAPLSGVGNLAQLMADTRSSFTREEIEGYAQEIQLTSKRLNELLENLLNWARLQSGSLPIAPATIDFPRLFNQILRLFQPAASAKAITVTADPGGIRSVRSDPEILRTIMRNLVSNAIANTPGGGNVALSARRDGSALLVSVADSGDGISPEALEALTNDLFHGRPDGKGFGLVLCREMAEMLGGTIEVERRGEPGTTFVLRIPGAADAAPAGSTTELKTAASDLRQAK
jgi:signal transduction histidine kinase